MTLKLHELPADRGARQRKQRIGRGEGSGWGKTAGKGHKGAKSRSGGSKGGAFEGGQTPLVRRVPKFGFSNVSFRVRRAAITLRNLNEFDEGATVDLEALRKARLIPKSVRKVKVIATGELTRSLNVRLNRFSAGARAAIEAKGGTCETVAQ